MSGLPQGSSPRLRGVMHFLTQADHPVTKTSCPRAVRPAMPWASAHNDEVKISDLKPEDAIFEGFGDMLSARLSEIDGWSDTDKIHIDATFTDNEGNEHNHCMMVDVEICWCDEGNKLGLDLQAMDVDLTADELAYSLNKIWGD